MNSNTAIALFAFVTIGACSRDPHEVDDHCRFAAKYGRAQKAAQDADTDIASGDLTGANGILKRALADFDYSSEHSLDDTGMHLINADPAERNGDLKVAVTIRRNVLKSRMGMYELDHSSPCPKP